MVKIKHYAAALVGAGSMLAAQNTSAQTEQDAVKAVAAALPGVSNVGVIFRNNDQDHAADINAHPEKYTGQLCAADGSRGYILYARDITNPKLNELLKDPALVRQYAGARMEYQKQGGNVLYKMELTDGTVAKLLIKKNGQPVVQTTEGQGVPKDPQQVQNMVAGVNELRSDCGFVVRTAADTFGPTIQQNPIQPHSSLDINDLRRSDKVNWLKVSLFGVNR